MIITITRPGEERKIIYTKSVFDDLYHECIICNGERYDMNNSPRDLVSWVIGNVKHQNCLVEISKGGY